MRVLAGALVLAITGGAAFAFACGSASEEDENPLVLQYEGGAGEAGDAATGDAEPPEPHLSAFACGTTSCLAGEHACCGIGGSFACFSLEAGGCPSAGDAGADADAGPPLLCATYNNCPNDDDDCCYSPDSGSSCMSSCPSGAIKLCQLGVDGCGEEYDCETMMSPPLPNTGQCQKKD